MYGDVTCNVRWLCAQKSPELKFKYVEEENPEDFFVPYSWSLAYRASGLHLCAPERVHLFPVPLPPSPANSGEEKLSPAASTAAASTAASAAANSATAESDQRRASPTPAATSSAPGVDANQRADYVNNAVARAQAPMAV